MKNTTMNRFLDYLGERGIRNKVEGEMITVGGGFSAEYRPESWQGCIHYPERVLIVGAGHDDGEYGDVPCTLEKLIESYERYKNRTVSA